MLLFLPLHLRLKAEASKPPPLLSAPLTHYLAFCRYFLLASHLRMFPTLPGGACERRGLSVCAPTCAYLHSRAWRLNGEAPLPAKITRLLSFSRKTLTILPRQNPLSTFGLFLWDYHDVKATFGTYSLKSYMSLYLEAQKTYIYVHSRNLVGKKAIKNTPIPHINVQAHACKRLSSCAQRYNPAAAL